MLYWIWFGLLASLGASLAYASEHTELVVERDQWYAICKGIAGVISLMAALLFSWPVLGGPFYDWLSALIPQPGTVMNKVTVISIIAALCVVFVVGISTGSMCLPARKRDPAPPSTEDLNLSEAIATLRLIQSHHATPNGVHVGFLMQDATAVLGSLAKASDMIAKLLGKGLIVSEPVAMKGEVCTIYRVADLTPPTTRSVH